MPTHKHSDISGFLNGFKSTAYDIGELVTFIPDTVNPLFMAGSASEDLKILISPFVIVGSV